MANAVVGVYDQLLDWALRLRGIRTSRRYRRLVALTARFIEKPILDLRQWMATVVAECDRLPTVLADPTAKEINIDLRVKIGVDATILERINKETRRLTRPQRSRPETFVLILGAILGLPMLLLKLFVIVLAAVLVVGVVAALLTSGNPLGQLLTGLAVFFFVTLFASLAYGFSVARRSSRRS